MFLFFFFGGWGCLEWSFSSKSAACEITGESISIQVQKPKSTD